MNSAVKFGIITSASIILLKLILFFSGKQLSSLGIYSNILPLIFILISIFAGIKAKRDKEPGGYITFREAIKQGMSIGVVTAILTAAFYYAYYAWIDHETLGFYISETEKAMMKDHKPQTDIDKATAFLKEFFSPARQATQSLLVLTIAGLVSSFIGSTFFVKRKPEAAGNQ